MLVAPEVHSFNSAMVFECQLKWLLGIVYVMSLTIISIIFLVLGLLFFIAAFRRLRKKKLFSACGHGTMSIIFISLGLLLVAFALNLYTYERLSLERHVADIRFIQIGPQKFKAILTLPDNTSKEYELVGDQWQLDARIIKWSPKGNLLGLDSRYRLERLNVRYNTVAQEKEPHVRTVYSLMDGKQPDFIQKYKSWMPWLDAVYGNSIYTPMADKAHFRIKITQSSLVPYPVNEEARKSTSNWK